MLSRQVATKLANYETPFYLYDIDLLHQTLDSLMSVARRYDYKVHYAIKANYDPRLLQIIREHGLGIDCASGNEVKCAVEAGFDPKTIVYAGVGKHKGNESATRAEVEDASITLHVGPCTEQHAIRAHLHGT